MAYSVTKPPIDIVFNLRHPIDIHSIKIWPEVGSLKSTAFEIYVLNERHMEWRKVAVCTDLTENCVLFEWSQELLVHEEESPSPVKRCQFFRHRNNRITAATVKLSIKHTRRGCTPVLQKVEIWGHPAISCTAADVNSISLAWNKAVATTVPVQRTIEANPNRTSAANKSTATLVFPDEFLDAITYEVMSLPMVLPSGKIVDQSTLNRCQRNDECWGRVAVDPFTGQCYSDLRKPIFDAKLKSRIDKFLMMNASRPETLQIPRTVGTAKRKHTAVASTTTVTRSPVIEISKRPRSLDEAVHSALQTITRFSKPLKNVSVISECCCLKCGQCNELYTLEKCSHFICRKCLLEIRANNDDSVQHCDSCGISFKSCDVKRLHYTKLLS